MSESQFLPQPYIDLPESGKINWQSPSNIALIKYWGKYGQQLPCNASLSFTLSNSHTITSLAFEKKSSKGFEFEVYLDGVRESGFEPKIGKFFERVEPYLPFLQNYSFKIETTNSFPHSSGIASSASGMSALALCLTSLESSMTSGGLNDMQFKNKASFLARLGSGSACRSIEGPLVVWGKHAQIQGSSNLYGYKYPFKVHKVFDNYQDTILLVDKGEKQVSSTLGHQLMEDHPYAEVRFSEANANLARLIPILKEGYVEGFIKIVESEALQLHAMMLTSMPYFILMKPNTLEIINRVWKFRRETESHVCFTLDAGANVHLLYPESEKQTIMRFIETKLSQFCKDGEYISDYLGTGAIKMV